MKPIITIENLGKAYRIGLKAEISDTLVGAVKSWICDPFRKVRNLQRLDRFSVKNEELDVIWALRDVSFQIKQGEVVGIIGRNGAGKSTLLKILSGITDPTCGRAVIRGRASSLLEIGTGFHQEMTGRDNIYMNGTILGMTKTEIDRKFDEIVDFSGVERFLDTPVKRYSSGMMVRLAFAVAAHLEPEILIVDEVLAVGDLSFQKRCIGKMQNVASSGRTVLFVSHKMAAIESLCTKGVLLAEGKLKDTGPISSVLSSYRKLVMTEDQKLGEEFVLRDSFFQNASLLDEQNQPTTFMMIGRELRLRMRVQANCRLVSPRIIIGINDLAGDRLLTLRTPLSMDVTGEIESSGIREVECRVPQCPLAPGVYNVILTASANGDPLGEVENALQFSVIDGEMFNEGHGHYRGHCVAPSFWSVYSPV